LADLAKALHLYDDYAERSALAGLLSGDMGLAVALAELLEPTDFHDARRQLLFEAVTNVLRSADPVSPDVILAESRHVRAERRLQVAIDADFIQAQDGDAGNAVEFATAVKKWAWARQFAGLSEQFLVKLQQNPDIDEFYAWAMSELQTLAPKSASNDIVYGWETVGLHKSIIDERVAQHEAGARILFDWPWVSWNQRIRPLRPGMVGVLGAPDGMGKTAILDSIAEHWARKVNVFLVHFEDSREYKLDRRLAKYSELPYDVIEDGKKPWPACATAATPSTTRRCGATAGAAWQCWRGRLACAWTTCMWSWAANGQWSAARWTGARGKHENICNVVQRRGRRWRRADSRGPVTLVGHRIRPRHCRRRAG
jgi:hypothetical protein